MKVFHNKYILDISVKLQKRNIMSWNAEILFLYETCERVWKRPFSRIFFFLFHSFNYIQNFTLFYDRLNSLTTFETFFFNVILIYFKKIFFPFSSSYPWVHLNMEGFLQSGMRLLGNPIFLLITIANALTVMACQGMLQYLPKYVENEFYLSPMGPGILLGE